MQQKPTRRDSGLFVALAKAGGEKEEENIDDAKFVKETSLTRIGWLYGRSSCRNKYKERVRQEPTKRNTDGVERGT